MMLDKILQGFSRLTGQSGPDATQSARTQAVSNSKSGRRKRAAEGAVRQSRSNARLNSVRTAAGATEGPNQSGGPFSGVRIFYFFLFALLFLALYLTYLLVSPFLHTIILACIFSALSYPLYKKMLALFNGKGFAASGVTLFILVVVVLLPLSFFVIQLIPQATRSISELAQWLGSAHLDELINNKIYPFLGWLNDEVTWIDLDVQDMRASLLTFSRRAGQLLLSWGTGFVVDSLNMALNFCLMLLIMFFLLKDGEGMIQTIKQLTPLRAEQKDNIIHNLRRMAKAVLFGGFMVAAIQGLVGGIGLAFVGIQPLFWGTVMAFAALVPVLGTALVWVPAALYLFLTGNTASALFLAGWCAILVGSIDSFLRPIIIRGSSKTSLLFLFLAVLGGIKAFGVLGIVYGPLILSFVGVMLGMYSDEYSESLDSYHRGGANRKRKFSAGLQAGDDFTRRKIPSPPRRRVSPAAAQSAEGEAEKDATEAAARTLPEAAGGGAPEAEDRPAAPAKVKQAHGKPAQKRNGRPKRPVL